MKMQAPSTGVTALLVSCFVTVATQAAPSSATDWPQWGGPDRDFSVTSTDIGWPANGPRELWRVELGPGESTIVTDGGPLFTAYREGNEEVFVALDRDTGERIWERRQRVERWDGFFADQGEGPYATPALVGDRLLTVTVDGTLLCLSQANGEPLWSAEPWSQWTKDISQSGPAVVGYTPSPLVHGEVVIVVGGGSDRAIQAYRWSDGSLVWSAASFDPGYASPILLEVGGNQQLVVFAADGLYALDPSNGANLWHQSHPTDYRVNASTPLLADGVVFLSSAYGSGSRGLRVVPDGDSFAVEELWHDPKIQVHHSSVVSAGGLVVGSSGDFGPAFLFGVDPSSGETAFYERGFAKANLVAVGPSRVVLLSEDGELALADIGADGVEIVGRADIFESRSWAAPTVIGPRVYARDRREIVALELVNGSS